MSSMKNTIVLLALALSLTHAHSQQTVPNLGEKVCPLWTAVVDRAKTDESVKDQLLMMDWWAMGYLKGMATSYAHFNKIENPLLKMRGVNESTDWMRAYCRVNSNKAISDAAIAYIAELESRPSR